MKINFDQSHSEITVDSDLQRTFEARLLPVLIMGLETTQLNETKMQRLGLST